MTFNDLVKYDINQILKIETNKEIYIGYIVSKSQNYITIIYYYPKDYTLSYFKNNTKLYIYNQEIKNISIINLSIFKVNKYYEINKEVLLRNEQTSFIEKYNNKLLKLKNIYDIKTTFPLNIVTDDGLSDCFSLIELRLSTKDMYRPKKKLLENNYILKYNELFENKDEDFEKYEDYFNQIENGNFYEVNDDIWNIIKDNNYDEKYQSYKQNNWKYHKLKISDVDEFGLIIYDENIINKFKDFDKILKHKNNNMFSYIDNENGIVYIMKY